VEVGVAIIRFQAPAVTSRYLI